MFSRKPGASKIALAALCAWSIQNQIAMIDCQQETGHLRSLGAAPIARQEFLEQLQISLNQTKIETSWTFDKVILTYWL